MSRASLSAMVAVLAVAAISAGCGDSGGSSDPLKLVPQQSDFPSDATWLSAPMPEGHLAGLARLGSPAQRGAIYSASIPVGQGSEVVSGYVVVFSSEANARKGFVFLQDAMGRTPMKRLPRLGDSQVARLTKGPTPNAEVLVRRNKTVWYMSAGAEAFYVITAARAQADLIKYATLQQERVGTG